MVDLARAKEHLRIEHDEEDDLIQAYLDAARAHVEAFCDRTIVDPAPGPDAPPLDQATQMLLTKDVGQAILLLVGHYYNNREATVLGAAPVALPFGVEALLWPRRSFR